MLQINSLAPDFNLKDKDGNFHQLSSFRGQKVVLYFYPKDNTPGCTSEALEFKRLYEEFKSKNTVIIGISKDSPSSHQRFIEKYDLPFLLLSDESLKVLQDYEVWKEKTLYGKSFLGVIRSTYVIDEEGKIVYAKEKVNAKANPSEVCSLL